jgi:hypothetical protein
MIEVSQLFLLVLVEIIIGLLILSGVLLFFTLRRKGRIRKAAHHLAERVKSDKPARTERLKTLLNEKYGYDGNELEQAVRNISQAEMLLFQNLINGYIKDDQIHLQQVDVDEENLVQAYQGLNAPAGAAAPAADAELDSGEELARLHDENQRLSDELRVTMDTMGRMLNEYSSMFAGGDDKPLTRAEAAEAEVEPEEASDAEVEVTADEVDLEAGLEGAGLDELLPDALGEVTDDLLDGGTEQASALDEEVSEIIDEVMEIADEMDREAATETASEEQVAAAPESLLDELEQVDIDIPELMPAQEENESEIESISESDPDAVLQTLAESETDSVVDALPEADADSTLADLSASEPEPVSEALTEPEPEPGSLEDEWAKLLEEDAESKQDPGGK